MSDFSVELIKDQSRLMRLANHLASVPVIALDIETVNWWNRHQERIALIQIAFRGERQPKVAIIDAFAQLDLGLLQLPLKSDNTIKVIHNAVFDASRLTNHYRLDVIPIYDTMAAARRNGERRYSLKAQAETHLGLHLDKGGQRSDWSRRPLDAKQIHYAALDAFSTLLLYENQIRRNLNGIFQLKDSPLSPQVSLPLDSLFEAAAASESPQSQTAEKSSFQEENGLQNLHLALLGIIAELPTRYHPDQLAASVGSERVGLAGWIVDRILGVDAEPDEETAKLGIADLCGQKLIEITETRRLKATGKGADLWRRLKSI